MESWQGDRYAPGITLYAYLEDVWNLDDLCSCMVTISSLTAATFNKFSLYLGYIIYKQSLYAWIFLKRVQQRIEVFWTFCIQHASCRLPGMIVDQWLQYRFQWVWSAICGGRGVALDDITWLRRWGAAPAAPLETMEVKQWDMQFDSMDDSNMGTVRHSDDFYPRKARISLVEGLFSGADQQPLTNSHRRSSRPLALAAGSLGRGGISPLESLMMTWVVWRMLCHGTSWVMI